MTPDRFTDAWLARFYRAVPAECMDDFDSLVKEFRRLRDQEAAMIAETDKLISGVRETNAALEKARHPMRYA